MIHCDTYCCDFNSVEEMFAHCRTFTHFLEQRRKMIGALLSEIETEAWRQGLK